LSDIKNKSKYKKQKLEHKNNYFNKNETIFTRLFPENLIRYITNYLDDIFDYVNFGLCCKRMELALFSERSIKISKSSAVICPIDIGPLLYEITCGKIFNFDSKHWKYAIYTYLHYNFITQ
jgi:hypothetical protein